MKKIFLISITLCFAFSKNSHAQTPYYPMPNSETKPATESAPKKKNGKMMPEYGPPRQNIFKLNMLSPIYSTVMIFYQRNLQSNNSFQIGLGYMDFNTLPNFITPTGSYSGANTGNQDENTKAFFITPEYRYMLFGEQMNGVFIAPFLKYTKMDYVFSNQFYKAPGGFYTVDSKCSYQSLGIGILLGQQWIVRNKISIELFGGTVYNTLLEKTMSPFPGSSYTLNGTTKTKWDEIETSRYISTANIRGYGIRAGFTIGFLF